MILESAESTELEDEVLVARTLVDRENSNDLRMVNLLQYLYLALLQSLLGLGALSQFFEAELLDTDQSARPTMPRRVDFLMVLSHARLKALLQLVVLVEF